MKTVVLYLLLIALATVNVVQYGLYYIEKGNADFWHDQSDRWQSDDASTLNQLSLMTDDVEGQQEAVDGLQEQVNEVIKIIEDCKKNK